MFCAIAPVAWTQAEIVRSIISTGPVMLALTRAGMAVNSSQIELLAGAGSTKESASVRVVSMSGSAGGTMKVKLRCQDNQECLPFYVLVHGLNGASATRGMQAVKPSVQAASVQPSMVRSGDHATLLLESADSRMRLPVICLQGGARGQKIRVSSLDHRQFFDAEIVASGVLKGIL